MVDDKLIEDYIYRIISGFYFIEVDGVAYKVLSPSLSIKREASFIYNIAIDNNKFELGWLSKDLINKYLEYFGFWNKQKEELQDSLEKANKKAKTQLYLNFFNKDYKKTIKQEIININKNLTSLFNDKHIFDHLTLEHYASTLRNQFLVSKTVYYNDELLFNNNFDDTNVSLLEKIVIAIYQNQINIDDIKLIARNDLWRGFWNAGDNKVFSNPTTQLTDEQISLLNISKTLDHIRQHPECPAEEIINDLDALDGWIYYQSEKAEKEKKKQALNDKYGLDKKQGSEVFLVTDSKEEAKEIFQMNDIHTQRNLKEMAAVVKNKESLEWSEVPFVQREIRNELQKKRPGK